MIQSKYSSQYSKSVPFFASSITLMALLFLAIPSPTSGQNLFEGLGDLAGGIFDSRAYGLSPDGTIVVGRGINNDGARGFRWTSADGLLQLDGIFNGTTIARGVSDTGRMVGRSPGLFDDFASYWNADGSFGFSLGDFAGGAANSEANDVSADGAVIVGWGTDENGVRAFRWESGLGMQHLGLSDSTSMAHAISDDGSTIVGELTNSFGDNEAFVWHNGFATQLGDLAGLGFFSTADDVSGNGDVVVGHSESGIDSNEPFEAFRWTVSGGMEGLGRLDGKSSFANAVSHDGTIIVGSSNLTGFIWDSQQGMRPLTDVLTQDFGMDLDGWSTLIPQAISADGLTITGYGRSPDTVTQYDFESFRVKVDAAWIRESSGLWHDRSMWAFGIDPNEFHDILITPDTGLTVTKSVGHSTIRSLLLNATNGIATLDLAGGNLTVQNETEVFANGRITGDGTLNALGGILNSGVIDLDGGQITGGTIDNFDQIGGDGVIASQLNNSATGQIRVESGQHLHLNGVTSPNEGLIDVVGGTFEVSRTYNNGANASTSSLIFARDAALRLNGGLTNVGSVGVSFGNTEIYGDVDNTSLGWINISGGANATFLDDLVQNGTLEVVRVGSHVSSVVIFGAVSGSGGFVGGGDVFALGDLRPGNSPASVLMDGNLFMGASTETIIELGGLVPGEFDHLHVTGDLFVEGGLTVDLYDGFTLSLGDTFLFAEVDGDLFGQFNGLDEGDIVGEFNDLKLRITYHAGDGNDIGLYVPVTVDPNQLSVIRGTHVSGSLAELSRSDDVDLTIHRHPEDVQSRTEFEVASVATSAIPSFMSITVEGSVFARTTVIQEIQAYNFDSNQFETVDSRDASRFTDNSTTIELTGNLDRYVEDGTDVIRARVVYRSLSSRQQFTSNTDLVTWGMGD